MLIESVEFFALPLDLDTLTFVYKRVTWCLLVKAGVVSSADTVRKRSNDVP